MRYLRWFIYAFITEVESDGKVSAELLDVLERIERLHPEWQASHIRAFKVIFLSFTRPDRIQIEMRSNRIGHTHCSISIKQTYEDGSEPAIIYEKSFSQFYQTTDCLCLDDYVQRTAYNVWAAEREAKRDKDKEREARERFFGK